MRRRLIRDQNRPPAEKYIPAVPDMSCQRMRWDAIIDRIPDGKVTAAVEIGVLYGATSARVLRARPLLTLTMIDPWLAPPPDSSYFLTGDTNAVKSQADHDKAFSIAQSAVRFAEQRAHIVRGFSVPEASGVKDGSLDLVFIDGDHSYNGVKADIDAWAQKVRTGGYIGGHDYDHPLLPGVKQAVDERFRPDQIEHDGNRTWFVRM